MLRSDPTASGSKILHTPVCDCVSGRVRHPVRPSPSRSPDRLSSKLHSAVSATLRKASTQQAYPQPRIRPHTICSLPPVKPGPPRLSLYANWGPGWWKRTDLVGIDLGFIGGLKGLPPTALAASAAAFAAFSFSSSGSCQVDQKASVRGVGRAGGSPSGGKTAGSWRATSGEWRGEREAAREMRE